MKLDLLPPGSWENYCQQLEKSFPMPEGGEGLRAYRGAAHALHEALVSLAQLYPHKRSLVVIEGTTPHFAPQLKHFSKEGYNIIRLLPEALSSTNWAEELPKDCLLVLAAQEHAVTGELFELAELEEAATQQRVFCVRYSHSLWAMGRLPKFGKYTVQICQINPEVSVLLYGGRFKSAPLITQLMYWPPLTEDGIKVLLSPKSESPDQVREFEKTPPQGFKAFFSEKTNRLYDRSVLVAEDLSADALVEELAESIGVKLMPAPVESQLDSPNQCRWGEIAWKTWWLHQPPFDEEFRGLVVIDHTLLKDKKFQERLAEACSKIKGLQSFSTSK